MIWARVGRGLERSAKFGLKKPEEGRPRQDKMLSGASWNRSRVPGPSAQSPAAAELERLGVPVPQASIHVQAPGERRQVIQGPRCGMSVLGVCDMYSVCV